MARIHEAIIQVMQRIGAVGKNSLNKSQGYAYRSADDVYNAVAPLMAEYGICSAPKVLQESHETGTSRGGGSLFYTRLLVQYTFFASDGTSVECTVASEGMDSGDKATPKAMTVAHRYAICQLFVIPVADVTIDSERDSHEYQPPRRSQQQKSKPKDEPAKQEPAKAEPAKEREPAVSAEFAESISAVKELWKSMRKRSNEDATKEGWQAYVFGATARKFDALKTSEWTPDDVFVVSNAIDTDSTPPPEQQQ